MEKLYAWMTRLLALAALVLSGYLTYAGITAGEVYGCSWSALDCDAALSSAWSKWLGLPVAAGGALCYAAALVGACLAGRDGAAGSSGWRVLEATSVLAIAAGGWFVAVQAIWLDSFCLYCLATHACGLAMAISSWLWRANARANAGQAWPVAAIASVEPSVHPIANRIAGPPAMGSATVVGLLGVAALIAGQLLVQEQTSVALEPELEETIDLSAPPPEPTESEPAIAEASTPVGAVEQASATVAAPPEPKRPAGPPKRRKNGSREVSLLRGTLKIDTYEHPVLGSPEAPHVIVEMMDYACPHCREFHEKLQEALRRFDGQVAVVVMPVPGEILCNPYVQKAKKESIGACYAAKLAVAVAQYAPADFESFHHWMLQKDKIPQRASALVEARRYIEDRQEFGQSLRDANGRPGARVKQYIELAAKFQRQGKFGLPSQIIGEKLYVGPPKTVDQVCEQWAEGLGIEAPSAELPF